MSKEKATEETMDSAKSAVSGFLKEVSAEFHRTTWPRGHELLESTMVVLAFIFILSVAVFCFDAVLGWSLKAVL